MERNCGHTPKTVKIRGALIQMFWDDDASVWVATSEDIPGLVLEDTDFRKLERRVDKAAEELRMLNANVQKARVKDIEN